MEVFLWNFLSQKFQHSVDNRAIERIASSAGIPRSRSLWNSGLQNSEARKHARDDSSIPNRSTKMETEKRGETGERRGTRRISHGYRSLPFPLQVLLCTILSRKVWLVAPRSDAGQISCSLLSDLCIPVGNQYFTELTADRFVIRERNANTLRKRHKSIGRQKHVFVRQCNNRVVWQRLLALNRLNRFEQEIATFIANYKEETQLRGSLGENKFRLSRHVASKSREKRVARGTASLVSDLNSRQSRVCP